MTLIKSGPSEAEERTESDVLAGTPVMVTLADREYEIGPIKGRKHTRRMRQVLGDLMVNVEDLGALIAKAQSVEAHGITPDDWAGLSSLLSKFFGPELDALLDLVYEWHPNIAADREYLDENADDIDFLLVIWKDFELLFGPLASRLGIKGTNLSAAFATKLTGAMSAAPTGNGGTGGSAPETP